MGDSLSSEMILNFIILYKLHYVLCSLVTHSGADFCIVDYIWSQCSQWVSCLLCLWTCHLNPLHTVHNVLNLSTHFTLNADD
jgi:hypothetical protein